MSPDAVLLIVGFLVAHGAYAGESEQKSAPQEASAQEVNAQESARQEEHLKTRLRAEIHGPTAIRFTLSGVERPSEPSAYRLTDGHGREIPIAEVVPNTASESLLVPEVELDPMRVHYLEIPRLGLRALVRRDPLFRNLYSSKPLGAVIAEDGSETTFRIFSPRALAVRLYLYHDRNDGFDEALRVVEMTKDEDGVWEATEARDLHGTWYDFTVHGPTDPGNWFYETHPVHVSDPYALVNDCAMGKSRVWRDGPPPPPVVGGRPSMEDVVAYEVHVQDFTDLLPVEEEEAGTLPAMARTGLVNTHGEPVGLNYLADLGVNVVHLMPVQEYLHYPDTDWQAAFANDPFARAMGIDRENYQWGYRTTHAFAVESRFRSRDAEPGAEREQFRALVRALHERGIAVIIDVVPNHTGENMDDQHLLLNFNVLDLPYYYRTDQELEHIGPFGNEVKSEERPMVQRWIVDQLGHWVEDLGVDGFRIDLAGQLDEQTLLRVKQELPEDLIIYGEAWIPPSDPDVRSNPDWSWYKADAPITFFQDEARNAFKGSPFEVSERGWAGGDGSVRKAVMRALPNHYAEEPRTTNGISYLDIHDNWALADRYALNDDYNGLEGVDLAPMRIAAGLLLTSAGPVVIHGGTEMLRSKGLAPREEFEVEAAGALILFKGRDDTYNLRAPNRFLWESLVPGSDQTAMRDYWRGLLALRMSEHGRVFRIAELPEGHYRWIAPEESTLLGYAVGERVLVLANSGAHEGAFRFDLPDGAWRQVGAVDRVDLNGIEGEFARLDGGTHEVRVPGGAFLVWVREFAGPSSGPYQPVGRHGPAE
jgi:pullulanase/glycogen debranching enzyme